MSRARTSRRRQVLRPVPGHPDRDPELRRLRAGPLLHRGRDRRRQLLQDHPVRPALQHRLTHPTIHSDLASSEPSSRGELHEQHSHQRPARLGRLSERRLPSHSASSPPAPPTPTPSSRCPDGSITKTLDDGTVVTVIAGRRVRDYQPRRWAPPRCTATCGSSGTAVVDVSGPNDRGGSIEPGYVVACQTHPRRQAPAPTPASMPRAGVSTEDGGLPRSPAVRQPAAASPSAPARP